MTLLTHRWFRILVLLSVMLAPVLSACSFALGEGATTDDPPAAALPAAPEPDSVSAEGIVTPVKKVDLSFEGSGRVAQILVSEGDRVIAGQQLAVLETGDLEQGVLQAQARLQSAEAQMAKTRAGARPEEIVAAQAGLEVARAGANAALAAVGVAEGRLAAAQADYQAARDAVADAQSQLTSARAAHQAAEAAYNKLQAQPTELDVQIAAKRVETAKNNLYDIQLLFEKDKAIDAEIEQRQVELDIAQLNLDRVKAGARPEDVAEAQGLMERARANISVAEAQVAKARALAEQAEAGIRTAEAGVLQAQAQLARAEAQRSQAQAELDLAVAGSRAEDVAAAQAQVKQAEASLAAAQNALEDARLDAPFGGTVGLILIDEGDMVGPQTTALQLGDLSRMQIKTQDLSEMDVDRVEAGQRATITVDALDGKELPATVAAISPLAGEERGDTVYQVTLDLEPGAEADLRWGMTTLVDIETGLEPPAAAQATDVEISGDAVVSAQAVIVACKSAGLSFKAPGRVQQLLVAEGDSVAAGQELARQETRNLEQNVLQAEARLAQAEASLAKAKAGARKEEVASARAAVEFAGAEVRAAEAAVAAGEGQLAVAQAEVKAAQAASNMARGQVAVMRGALSAAQARLDKARNGSTALDLQIAQKQVDLAIAALRVVERKEAAAYGVLEGKAAALRAEVDIARLQLMDLKAGTDQADIAAAEAEAAQASSDVQAAQAQYSQAQAQVLVAQAGVQIAEAELMQAAAEVEIAQAQVQQAQARLDTLTAGSRQEDIAAAAADVAEATAALAAAKNTLDDATLKALFDGIVGAVWVDEGQLVQPADLVVTLGDLSLLEAETEDLSEVDVSRIRVGQRAAVTVDAVGGLVLVGTVSRIAPVATERRGDTVYTVTLDLDGTSNTRLRWGMSAFVEIDTTTPPEAPSDAGTMQDEGPQGSVTQDGT